MARTVSDMSNIRSGDSSQTRPVNSFCGAFSQSSQVDLDSLAKLPYSEIESIYFRAQSDFLKNVVFRGQPTLIEGPREKWASIRKKMRTLEGGEKWFGTGSLFTMGAVAEVQISLESMGVPPSPGGWQLGRCFLVTAYVRLSGTTPEVLRHMSDICGPSDFATNGQNAILQTYGDLPHLLDVIEFSLPYAESKYLGFVEPGTGASWKQGSGMEWRRISDSDLYEAQDKLDKEANRGIASVGDSASNTPEIHYATGEGASDEPEPMPSQVPDLFRDARQDYVSGRYSECLTNLEALHDLIDSYENSLELRSFCQQGLDLIARQNRN